MFRPVSGHHVKAKTLFDQTFSGFFPSREKWQPYITDTEKFL